MTANVLLFWISFVIVSAACAAVLIAVILVMDFIAHPAMRITDAQQSLMDYITRPHNDNGEPNGH